jgi:hypothetical protein
VQSRNAPPVFARKYLKVLIGGSIARRSLPKARYDDLFALETVVHSCPWLKLEVRKYEIVDGPASFNSSSLASPVAPQRVHLNLSPASR